MEGHCDGERSLPAAAAANIAGMTGVKGARASAYGCDDELGEGGGERPWTPGLARTQSDAVKHQLLIRANSNYYRGRR